MKVIEINLGNSEVAANEVLNNLTVDDTVVILASEMHEASLCHISLTNTFTIKCGRAGIITNRNRKGK